MTDEERVRLLDLALMRADVACTLPEEVSAALAVVHGLDPSPNTPTAALIDELRAALAATPSRRD
jgi:hypothetical protein